jgi:hypothetical protein
VARIGTLVTDANAPASLLEILRQQGVNVVVAEAPAPTGTGGGR